MDVNFILINFEFSLDDMSHDAWGKKFFKKEKLYFFRSVARHNVLIYLSFYFCPLEATLSIWK